MLAGLASIRGRLHKQIRVRELVALNKLEQMLRVRLLEQQATWKRGNDFDRIEIIAERYEETPRRLYVGYDPEPFHIGLYDTRWPPTSEAFTVDVKAVVERLKLELLFSQSPPPQLLSRRLPAQPPQQPCLFPG